MPLQYIYKRLKIRSFTKDLAGSYEIQVSTVLGPCLCARNMRINNFRLKSKLSIRTHGQKWHKNSLQVTRGHKNRWVHEHTRQKMYLQFYTTLSTKLRECNTTIRVCFFLLIESIIQNQRWITVLI